MTEGQLPVDMLSITGESLIMTGESARRLRKEMARRERWLRIYDRAERPLRTIRHWLLHHLFDHDPIFPWFRRIRDIGAVDPRSIIEDARHKGELIDRE